MSLDNLKLSIRQGIDFLNQQGAEIPVDVLLDARRYGIFKAAGNLAEINMAYHDVITKSLTDYFEGGSVTSPRSKFKQGATQAFGDAFDLGTKDGGGSLPFTGDALDWFNTRLQEEFGHIDGLFEQAKLLRKDSSFDWFSWVTDRADNYTRTISSIYNAAVMWAKGNQMLTWQLGATEQHCRTCSKLDGSSHRASWYIGHDYIPRKPGAAMDCGGYNCDCSLMDKNKKVVTISQGA